MGYTIAQKIIKSHLVSGEMIPGTEIGLRIDQTLTQDATGTMAYLQLEAMGIERVNPARGRQDHPATLRYINSRKWRHSDESCRHRHPR